MYKSVIALLTALMMMLFVPTVVSHGETKDDDSVYGARHDYMTGLGSSMKAFSNFLKRDEGEPLELGSMAAEIAATANTIPDLFPPDTGMEQNEESEAKSVIWAQWDDFVKAAENLAPLAAALESAFDSGDKGAIGGAVKKLGQEGCRGCHKQFREKKE